jgi:hypothetical protein
VILFLGLADCLLRRTVTGQLSQLERLHHRLRQEKEQQDSSSLPQQKVESVRRPVLCPS